MFISLHLEVNAAILTDTRQPPASMVGLRVKLITSPGKPSGEVWLALMDRGVADTSWNRKQTLGSQKYVLITLNFTLFLEDLDFFCKLT